MFDISSGFTKQDKTVGLPVCVLTPTAVIPNENCIGTMFKSLDTRHIRFTSTYSNNDYASTPVNLNQNSDTDKYNGSVTNHLRCVGDG